ncbi:LysR family transcriptional regulator [Caulobacter sp. RHG1]|uniref:LysR family transcriptional regulator n=1 Tax=Caulobacter sp. (strain RHG1) TaxID=2545762 RepID=UPI00155298E3|nr:LysR substrate-binding domain-containing protein [Caulobacter sp. RHG1]
MARRGPDRLRGIKLHQVRYVVSAAEHRSFRQAAAALHVEQSTVSRRVRDLEHQLGAALFERSACGVRLTTIGERFLVEARAAMDQLEGAAGLARELGAAEASRLRIGVSAPVGEGGLGDWLRRALGASGAPMVQVAEASPAELRRALDLQAIDLICEFGGRPQGHIKAHRLWRETLMVLVRRDHELARSERLAWADLVNAPLILARDHAGVVEDALRMHGARGEQAQTRREAVGLATLVSLVAWGQGLTILPASLAQTSHPEVIAIPLDHETVDVMALWSSRNNRPALARFLRLLVRGQTPERS